VAVIVLRRRRLPDHLEERRAAFEALVPELERAKDALTQSVPGTRLPGRPLAETLFEFEEGVRRVRAGMGAWRSPELEDVWRGADSGLADALALAERVRIEAPEPAAFEALVGLIGDLLAPLEPFASAAERFRELRRSTERSPAGRPSRS
jgi:hypothetical protein